MPLARKIRPKIRMMGFLRRLSRQPQQGARFILLVLICVGDFPITILGFWDLLYWTPNVKRVAAYPRQTQHHVTIIVLPCRPDLLNLHHLPGVERHPSSWSSILHGSII